MQLRDYWELALKHRWLLLIAVLLSAGLAYGVSQLASPAYRATASVFVSLPYGNTPAELSQGSSFAQNQMLSYAQLATMPVVLDPVITRLGLEYESAKDLSERVTTRATTDSTIMQIQVSDGSATEAARIANAIADQLGQTARDLSPKNADKEPTVDISMVGEAVPPAFAYSPNTKRNVLAGLIAGLFAAYGFVLLREKLDTRIRDTQDVQALTDSPLLAEFGEDRGMAGNRLVLRHAPLAPAAEEFRRLRSNVRFLGIDRRPLALVVTSSLPGEGKSTVLLNLALASAQAGERVLVVDADLRKPSVAEYLGLEGAAGLTTILTGEARFEDVVFEQGRGQTFDVVTSGAIPPNPLELLGSRAMAEFIERVRPHYDVILIDTPPLMPVIDAAVLAHQATGAIFVSRAYKVSKDQFSRSLKALDNAGARVLGIVVNGLPGRGTSSYYGYVYAEDNGKGTSKGNGGAGPARTAGASAHKGGKAPRGRTSTL